MKSIFDQIQIKKPPRSAFDLSHQVNQTGNFGYMYPCLVLDVVPGDSISLSCDALVRLQPLVTPMFERIDAYVHYWFVPNRLTWPGWEGYITQQPYDNTSMIPAHPYVTLNSDITPDLSKFLTYFGLPDAYWTDHEYQVNALPFAAYQCIYNEWYRDQNLIDPVNYTLVNGDNDATKLTDLLVLRKRAWAHDYLTSALPFAQKGPAVSIPLGDVALKFPWATGPSVNPAFVGTDGDPDNGALAQAANLLDPTQSNVTIGGFPKYAYDPSGTLTVAPTTINDLRRAYRLQEWYEKQARGGTRYIEVILAHFGVKSSDARLQRPEFITGARNAIRISEVLQTSATDTTTPQGNLAGHGVAGLSGNYGRYFAEEHGFIVGIVTIMPKAVYAWGIPKMFTKINDPFQYYWPEFANIGEQAITYSEVNAEHATPTETFGYIPRYAEYKYMNNRIAGDFIVDSSMQKWVMFRELDATVALNQEFIECTPNYDNFAVTDPDQDHILMNIWHNIRAVRPMPFYGTPTI